MSTVVQGDRYQSYTSRMSGTLLPVYHIFQFITFSWSVTLDQNVVFIVMLRFVTLTTLHLGVTFYHIFSGVVVMHCARFQ